MKFLLISDLHLLWENPVARLDDAHKTIMEKFKYVLEYTSKNELSILQAGDFFDKPRSWYLLPNVIDLMQYYREIPIYTVFGQHDKYMYSENLKNTNLGILDNLYSVSAVVLNSSYDNGSGDDWGECGIWGVGSGEILPKWSFDKWTNEVKILIIHAPIYESKLWPTQEGMDAEKFLLEHSEFDLILCGDIHQKFLIEKDGRIICNTGPMFRREATEYNMKHKPGFYVYDTDTREIEWHEIPHRHASEVLTRQHIEEKERLNSMLEKFIEGIPLKDEIGERGGVSFEVILKKLIEKEDIGEEVKKIIGELMEEM